MFWICSKKIWLGWTLCTEVATMLFSEIYGSYFNVVAAVLSESSDGKLTDRRMTELVREKAFAESALAIPAALKSGTWPLLDQEYHSILHHKPTMPLTMLQKSGIKRCCLIPESLCLIRTRPGWKMLIRCMLRTPSFSLTSTRTEIRMGIPPT